MRAKTTIDADWAGGGGGLYPFCKGPHPSTLPKCTNTVPLEVVKQKKVAVLLQKALTFVPRVTIEPLNLIVKVINENGIVIRAGELFHLVLGKIAISRLKSKYGGN